MYIFLWIWATPGKAQDLLLPLCTAIFLAYAMPYDHIAIWSNRSVAPKISTLIFWVGFLFCFCFFAFRVVLRHNSWFYTQGSFLAVLGDHMRCCELNPSQPLARQAPYTLYYLSGSQGKHLYLCIISPILYMEFYRYGFLFRTRIDFELIFVWV